MFSNAGRISINNSEIKNWCSVLEKAIGNVIINTTASNTDCEFINTQIDNCISSQSGTLFRSYAAYKNTELLFKDSSIKHSVGWLNGGLIAVYNNTDSSITIKSTVFNQNACASAGAAGFILLRQGSNNICLMEDIKFTDNIGGGNQIYVWPATNTCIINETEDNQTLFADNQSSTQSISAANLQFNGGTVINSKPIVLYSGTNGIIGENVKIDSGIIVGSGSVMVNNGSISGEISVSTNGQFINNNQVIGDVNIAEGGKSCDVVFNCTAGCSITVSRSFENGEITSTPNEEPTCLSKGTTVYEFSGVYTDENGDAFEYEDSLEVYDVSAKGHTDGEWKNTKPSTCVEAGEDTLYCAVCKEAVDTRELAVLDHELVTVTAQIPTCVQIGWNEYEYCKNCDYSTYDEFFGSHIPGEPVKENELSAICLKDGYYYEAVYCSECNDKLSYEYKQGAPATGHVGDETDGICDICGENTTPPVGSDGCVCHRGDILSKIVRFLYTIISLIFRKKVTCCDDMAWYFDNIGSLS